MNLRKRLQALEPDFSDGEVTLWLAAGSTQRVRLRRLLQMIPEIVLREPLRVDTQAVIDSVRDNCKAMGEGRLQRFVFVFTPTHGSWLNLIENQFSKMTRTMLRAIRVASQQELIDRIHQYFEEINAAPVVFRWKYKMDETIIV
jgi:hypothetical protein